MSTNTQQAPLNNELNVVKSKILSIVAALQNIDDERDQIKAITETLKADHGISPKTAKKAAKIIHKDNAQALQDEADELDALMKRIS